MVNRWATLGIAPDRMRSEAPRLPETVPEALAWGVLAFDARDPVEAILLGVEADLQVLAALIDGAHHSVPRRLSGALWNASNRIRAAVTLLALADRATSATAGPTSGTGI
jgi:hypothetical protein